MKMIQHILHDSRSLHVVHTSSASSAAQLIRQLLFFLVFFGVLEAVHATPVQWQLSQGGNGHWYEAVLVGTNRVTWAQAQAAAEAAGGYLATISSAAENAFVYGQVATNEAFWTGGDPWLGGYQPNGSAEPADGWRWVTGEPWSFTNWEVGEPNNFSGPENYLAFWNTINGRSSRWNDTQDNPMPSYIVEWESTPPLNLEYGLVAYYPLNGNANDESGNGNYATVHGAVSFVPGRNGGAAQFGSSGGFIECTNSALGNFGQSDFTIACWVRTETGGALVSKRESCDCGSSYVDLRVGRSNILPDPLPQDVLFETCGGGGQQAYVESPLIYTNSTWHQVAAVRSGNKLVTYADGTKTGETTAAQVANIHNLVPLWIGRSACTGVDPTPVFVGEIDEVRIYSRALSGFDVQRLYAFDSGHSYTSLRKAVRLDHEFLKTGTNYQLQVSHDLNTWFNFGSPFTATASTNSQYLDVGDWNAFFRLVTP